MNDLQLHTPCTPAAKGMQGPGRRGQDWPSLPLEASASSTKQEGWNPPLFKVQLLHGHQQNPSRIRNLRLRYRTWIRDRARVFQSCQSSCHGCMNMIFWRCKTKCRAKPVFSSAASSQQTRKENMNSWSVSLDFLTRLTVSYALHKPYVRYLILRTKHLNNTSSKLDGAVIGPFSASLIGPLRKSV